MKSTKQEAKRLELVEQVSRSVKALLLARRDIRLGRIGPAADVNRVPPAVRVGGNAQPALLPSLNQDFDFDDMLDEIDRTLH